MEEPHIDRLTYSFVCLRVVSSLPCRLVVVLRSDRIRAMHLFTREYRSSSSIFLPTFRNGDRIDRHQRREEFDGREEKVCEVKGLHLEPAIRDSNLKKTEIIESGTGLPAQSASLPTHTSFSYIEHTPTTVIDRQTTKRSLLQRVVATLPQMKLADLWHRYCSGEERLWSRTMQSQRELLRSGWGTKTE